MFLKETTLSRPIFSNNIDALDSGQQSRPPEASQRCLSKCGDHRTHHTKDFTIAIQMGGIIQIVLNQIFIKILPYDIDPSFCTWHDSFAAMYVQKSVAICLLVITLKQYRFSIKLELWAKYHQSHIPHQQFFNIFSNIDKLYQWKSNYYS